MSEFAEQAQDHRILAHAYLLFLMDNLAHEIGLRNYQPQHVAYVRTQNERN